MTRRTWTDEQTATLRAMRQLRASLSAIAAATGQTRNAVAGKIYRLGLPLIDPSNAHHAPRPSRGKYH